MDPDHTDDHCHEQSCGSGHGQTSYDFTDNYPACDECVSCLLECDGGGPDGLRSAIELDPKRTHRLTLWLMKTLERSVGNGIIK